MPQSFSQFSGDRNRPPGNPHLLDEIQRRTPAGGDCEVHHLPGGIVLTPKRTRQVVTADIKWRIVPQGDDTVKVEDNGYFYRTGEDATVSQWTPLSDSGAITVTERGIIWASWVLTDEEIQTDGPPDNLNNKTSRKTPGGGAPTFSFAAGLTKTAGTSNSITGSEDHHIPIGIVDLDDDNKAFVELQLQRDYFFFPQDNYSESSA